MSPVLVLWPEAAARSVPAHCCPVQRRLCSGLETTAAFSCPSCRMILQDGTVSGVCLGPHTGSGRAVGTGEPPAASGPVCPGHRCPHLRPRLWAPPGGPPPPGRAVGQSESPRFVAAVSSLTPAFLLVGRLSLPGGRRGLPPGTVQGRRWPPAQPGSPLPCAPRPWPRQAWEAGCSPPGAPLVTLGVASGATAAPAGPTPTRCRGP